MFFGWTRDRVPILHRGQKVAFAGPIPTHVLTNWNADYIDSTEDVKQLLVDGGNDVG